MTSAPRVHPSPRRKILPVLLGTLLLVAAPSLRAHHGLAAFDTTHTIKLEGTITGQDWVNPHAFIYVDVKGADGKVVNWKLELGSLGMLTKYGGWTEKTAKRGLKVTFQGFPAKDGSPYLSLGRMWFPDGQSREGKP